MDPTPTMVPTPIITPSTVRKERTLFSRSVVSARPITEKSSFMPLVLRPQRDNGIEPGGAPRGINTEEKPDRGGQRDAQQNGVQRHLHRHRREIANDDRDRPGDGHAD